jgi:hypothetical protein
MPLALFKHKKSKRVIEVPFVYNWAQDKFWCTYLGRTFWDSETPYIGHNWKYVGMRYEHNGVITDQPQSEL